MLHRYRLGGAALLLVLTSTISLAGETKAPADAKLYFIAPANGATVKSPFPVKFGLTGMGVAPALVDWPNTGHHHLLIDAPLPTDLSAPIANDAGHKHFGGGQTETMLTLPPGKHTLQLLMGDQTHVPHNPVISSDVITITVE